MIVKFFHYHAGTVSRSSGRSCVQAVAYAARKALFEERRGIVADYRNAKKHDVFWETLSLEDSGIAKDDLEFWNKPDLAEDKILNLRHPDVELRQKKINSAVTAYVDEFALPNELTREQNIELVREFVMTAFVKTGLVATYFMHWLEGNFHAHIVFSARPYENGEFSSSKSVSRPLRGPAGVRSLRKLAAQTINKHQELAGLEDRVDERSYFERGIDLIPTQHKGRDAHQLERDGHYSRIATENQQIFQENKERIAAFPSIILQELISTRATFSERDVLRCAQNRLKDEPGVLIEHVFHAALQEAVSVGKDIHGQMRYTTQEYADRESEVLESLKKIGNQQASIKIDSAKIETALSCLEEQAQETGFKPTEEQLNAIRTLCGNARLSVLIGRAGTGKTTTLRPVVELHKASGYKVWGMAPSAAAAKQLEADINVKCDTIAHYAYYWKKYDEALERLQLARTNKEATLAQHDIDKCVGYLPTPNTLIIVDEAGMVGVGDHKGSVAGGWHAITKIVSRTGAKLNFTGDDHQYKPVEGGDIFRKLVYDLRDTHRLCELIEIKRQNIDWMREVSQHLSELNVATALALYEHHGHLESYATNEDVYKAIAQQYLRKTLHMPDSTGTVTVATHEERIAINQEIRTLLKENGFLPPEDILQLDQEEYCIGDKIIFTKNDRGWSTQFTAKKKGFYVQNNMHAVIQSIKPCVVFNEKTRSIEKTFEIVAIVPKDKATVTFTLNQFKSFTHSYAVIGHKSQGATLDWVLAKLSSIMDAHALYVNLTRHRDDVGIYYAQEDFKGYPTLVASLSKTHVKDLVVDYSVTDEHQEYWDNVQDYKEFGRELVNIRRLALSLDKGNEELQLVWKNYKAAKEDHKSLAEVILRNWEEHKDFVRQVGLTRENIEIVAGLKKRDLSRLERQAQLTVEQYVSYAIEARQLWRDIRRTHPGIHAKNHPDWQKYKEACYQRGILANQIYLKPYVHRPFLKETAESLAKADIGYVTDQKISYSMTTIKAQAEAHQSKMLQEALLRDKTKPEQQAMLKTLLEYTETRDMAARIWQEVKPKLKAFEGTLLQGAWVNALDEYQEIAIKRNEAALAIITQEQALVDLAKRVGIKLDIARLSNQADQGTRKHLLETYRSHPEQLSRLEAAHKLHDMMLGEAGLEKKPTAAFLRQQGLLSKVITEAAHEYQKTKVFESLADDKSREFFGLLDNYDSHCCKARDLYAQCVQETKDKAGQRPWYSALYGEYKAAVESRNQIAIKVFDQRDYTQVVDMADKMGIRFKDVELEEIFSRCEQATRTRHIEAYLQAETPETKGEAAIALRQMIAFEKRNKNAISKTAQQAFHSGIDFKELQTTAFDYGRASILKGLSSAKDVKIYHALEAYESAARPANRTFVACLDEGKEKGIKPWETKTFKEYLAKVTVQDEKAHQLIKGYDAPSVAKIATEMGISVKKLDVKAHRHSLRKNLQTFKEGDRANVPQAAQELLHWIEFDRLSDHKHTFKVLREQNLWPKDLETSLREFSLKKRELRHESERASKGGKSTDTLSQGFKPSYNTYERQPSFKEVEEQLRARIVELATHLMDNPTRKTSTYLRFKGAICIYTSGPKQGLYSDYKAGIYGGPLKLIEEHAGLASAREAKEWAVDWLGGKAIVVERKIIEKAPEIKYATWTPITPVPKAVENPNIADNKYLNYMLKDSAQEVARYAYRDEEGRLKGYVVRVEKADGSKITPPLAYCQNDKGFKAWRWQAFEKESKTPYGIEKLAQDTGKPVLVVEGEKTCDAAQNLLPEYHVLTWSGGSGSVGKTNWQCLVGKDVTVWPDNDEGGLKAADTLQKIVTSLNTEQGLEGRARVVSLPETLPQKWDLADSLREGWTKATIYDCLNPSHTQDVDHELLTKINTTNEKYKLEVVDVPNKQMMPTFVQETTTYLKTLGIDEETAFIRSCYMLSETKRIKEMTPLSITYSQDLEDHALRISVVAAQVWHEGKQDKQKAVKDPIITAIGLVRKQDQERLSLIDKIHNRYIDHLSRDKVELVCDHAIRYKEANGKTLDDNKIHELVCEIYKREKVQHTADTQGTEKTNTQSQIMETYPVQTRQIKLAINALLDNPSKRLIQAGLDNGINPSHAKDHESQDLLAKITATHEKHGLKGVDGSLDSQIITQFTQETVSYLKGVGLEEDVAFTKACYMLSEITRIKDLTPFFMKDCQNPEAYVLRISVVAAYLWHESLQDKRLKVEDPVMTAIAQVKEHDKEQTELMEKIQVRYSHLPQAKIKAMCDYILRHKEATGKALDDMQIHQQLYEATKEPHLLEPHQMQASAHKPLEMHHEQAQQLQKTIGTLVHQQQQQQQMLQRTLQQKRGQELSL